MHFQASAPPETPSIHWGRSAERNPVSKSHPFKFTTNPPGKKRKMQPEERYHPGPFTNPPSTTPIHTTPTQIYTPVHPPVHPPTPTSSLPFYDQLIRVNYIASAYISLFMNAFLICMFILLAVKFTVTVKNDLSIKYLNLIESNKSLIAESKRQYLVNRCAPEQRVPALEAQCREWEQCMAKDPFREELTKVIFKIASDSLEEFLSGVSFRTVGICMVALAVFLKMRSANHKHTT
ncbi:hypothetical protein NEDG_00125 [Nematocida displodere]|uniref:Brl1/Brr6 domain-containing protein n=1 Tax=Nematocida displodere TaxID=1805483 RepID=A0A177EJU6_9MICR|nr:hypothetical protein NEDG_00125 [Nematocida displodere]